MVICVGFLVFIAVLGVIRIRSASQRSVEVNVEEKQEMEWDNSALTITVNPMDSEVVTVRFNQKSTHLVFLCSRSCLNYLYIASFVANVQILEERKKHFNNN